MENASKALIMAGSVLLSLLIISALVFLFNQIGVFKRSEVSEKDIEKLAEYTKQIETFNRDLYGSELLSLCNLIEDYNARQADLKGYDEIEVAIKQENPIESLILNSSGSGTTSEISIKGYYTSSKGLVKDFQKLEDRVNTLKKKKYYGKDIEKLAGLKDRELKAYLADKVSGIENLDLSDISSIANSTLKEMLINKENYVGLKTDLTTFKNKKFTIKYTYNNDTLRVKKIEANG